MKTHGYYFCDHGEELASGPRCEHCSALAPTVHFVHVPLHHNPFRKAGGQVQPVQPVSRERGQALWARLHEQLKF